MKKELFEKFTKEEQIEVLKELNIARKEEKKMQLVTLFKIPIFIIILVVVFILLFRTFIGTIEIRNPFGYEKNRFYEVTFNDQTVTTWTREHNRFPLIPWLVYWNSVNSNVCRGEKEHLSEIEEAKKYNLKVKSYSCYDEALQKRTTCKSEENELIEIEPDTIYTLKIEKRIYIPPTEEKDESWDVRFIYDGPFIEDVTDYIEEGAEYHFMITGKYGTATTNLDFYIDYHRGY